MSKKHSSDYVSIEVLVYTSASDVIVPKLEKKGFVATVPSEEEEFFDLVSKKFYIAIVMELDHPEPGSGFRFLSRLKRLSPLSHVYMIGKSPAPEDVAAAYRMGIKDFYIMKDMWSSSLVVRIIEDAREVTHKELMSNTVKDMWQLLGQAISELHKLHKKVVEMELNARFDGGMLPEEELPVATILAVVASEPLQKMIEKRFPLEKGWRVEMVPTGGEGLDIGASMDFDGYMIQEELPDMLGSMVLSSIRTSPRTPALLIKGDGEDATFVNMAGEELSMDDFHSMLLAKRRKAWEEQLEDRVNDTFRTQYLSMLVGMKRINEKMEKLGVLDKK